VLGIIVIWASNELSFSKISIESLTLTIVVEVFLLEIESKLVPIATIFEERKLIVQGADKALPRGERISQKADNCVYGIWCYHGYNEERLNDYYEKERELMKKIEFHRLINIEKAGIERVRRHCRRFEKEISSGQYVVTAVKYHSREFLVIDKSRYVLILTQNLFSEDIAGALGPFDEEHTVRGFANEYEELEKNSQANRLVLVPGKEDQSIDDWIAKNT
jgi:hypothetical protein